ncbi:GDP-L-fucose synthase [Variovorax sp. PAMC 28711]|uniref:GDP-L-fucose synthase n=1 Tax=Variovorax sp. PAMC 28711 TaxID=1795631 RepID=UPI00078E6A18|nr:GDP-L-fucose synthase [Variovorax sp. PAMC 28711]AMM25522.1 GDP-fucose synthetase [Variovorax sp. PAMC 28711]
MTAVNNLDKRIYVAGHRGMVGSAIVRKLVAQGYKNIIVRTRAELDLTNQAQVQALFATERPDEVYVAAAKVGGIHANNVYPAEFIYSNLMVEANLIHESWRAGVDKLLFLGSSCIYPRLATQPMAEDALLTGKLELTNEPYAVAKIAGIKLCESYNRQYGTDYRSVMPTNLYGPGDNYHPENSHVLPALIRRFHEAKLAGAEQVVIWGSGMARREFMYVDDMAEACVHVMDLSKEIYTANTEPMASHVNVGTGIDLTIAELAKTIAAVVGYEGEIVQDRSKPDGAPRKLLDVDLLRELGWTATTALHAGIEETYRDFMQRNASVELAHA